MPHQRPPGSTAGSLGAARSGQSVTANFGGGSGRTHGRQRHRPYAKPRPAMSDAPDLREDDGALLAPGAALSRAAPSGPREAGFSCYACALPPSAPARHAPSVRAHQVKQTERRMALQTMHQLRQLQRHQQRRPLHHQRVLRLRCRYRRPVGRDRRQNATCAANEAARAGRGAITGPGMLPLLRCHRPLPRQMAQWAPPRPRPSSRSLRPLRRSRHQHRCPVLPLQQ